MEDFIDYLESKGKWLEVINQLVKVPGAFPYAYHCLSMCPCPLASTPAHAPEMRNREDMGTCLPLCPGGARPLLFLPTLPTPVPLQVLNDPDFVSNKGKTKHELWVKLCSLLSKQTEVRIAPSHSNNDPVPLPLCLGTQVPQTLPDDATLLW